jgi:hypothetical protein
MKANDIVRNVLGCGLKCIRGSPSRCRALSSQYSPAFCQKHPSKWNDDILTLVGNRESRDSK